MRYLFSGPATDRIDWILDGLNGAPDWGAEAAGVLAPEFAALVPPDVFADRVRQRASVFAPGTVIGFDAGDHTARARVRVRDGSVQVVTCTVERAAPHRITATRTMALIPSVLTPRLPTDFTGYPGLAGPGAAARLIVFSGLPGAGKSTLAEAAGRALGVPVFAVDWLLGSLTPFGGYHLEELFTMGGELLTTGAQFRVVVCVCSDRELRRTRLEGRERGIPGWHDAGNWANVERRLAEFTPWTGEVLTIDAVQPLSVNLATVLTYVTG